MDLSFNNLRRLRYSSVNDTAVPSTQLPNILDAFIPGYTFFCKLTRDTLGYDVSNIAFTFLIVFTSATSLRYVVNNIRSPIARFCTAAITVDSGDFIHDCILAWAADHPTLGKARSLKAQSIESWADKCGFADAKDTDEQDWAANAAKLIPQYEMYKGSVWFWHRGHLFKLARADQDSSGMTLQGLGKLTLTVVGRSTQPIKDLIIETIESRMSKQAREYGRLK